MAVDTWDQASVFAAALFHEHARVCLRSRVRFFMQSPFSTTACGSATGFAMSKSGQVVKIRNPGIDIRCPFPVAFATFQRQLRIKKASAPDSRWVLRHPVSVSHSDSLSGSTCTTVTQFRLPGSRSVYKEKLLTCCAGCERELQRNSRPCFPRVSLPRGTCVVVWRQFRR